MVFQIAAPFLQAAAAPSLTAGAASAAATAIPAAQAGLSIANAGSLFGKALASPVASAGFLPSAAGLATKGGGSFMNALLGSPKGLAAFGKGVTSLGQIAGLMIGGEKGKKVAQSAGMFGLVSGLAPDIAGVLGAFKDPKAGTNLQQLGITNSSDYLNNNTSMFS